MPSRLESISNSASPITFLHPKPITLLCVFTLRK